MYQALPPPQFKGPGCETRDSYTSVRGLILLYMVNKNTSTLWTLSLVFLKQGTVYFQHHSNYHYLFLPHYTELLQAKPDNRQSCLWVKTIHIIIMWLNLRKGGTSCSYFGNFQATTTQRHQLRALRLYSWFIYRHSSPSTEEIRKCSYVLTWNGNAQTWGIKRPIFDDMRYW